jgi:MerR family transcriptional regulator, light-induced transcriptional regulator
MDLSQHVSTQRHPDGGHSESRVEKAAHLARIIEAEIIPRLMLAHRAEIGCLPLAPLDVAAPSAEEISEFAGLVLNSPVTTTAAYVEAKRQGGMSLETVYLDLLSPTARYLGHLWSEDLCDFSDVTLGLWRLQQLLHDLSHAFRADAVPMAEYRKTLLVPAPGEQHTFGLFMVSEFFRRAGWQVWGELPTSMEQLLTIVRSESFDMVGFSAGCELQIEALTKAIASVRKESKKRDVIIMVGGPIFGMHPEYVEAVGADATAKDGSEAVVHAATLAKSRQKTD